MFLHIFKYRMICALKDKQMIFWTLLFPIVLAVFFNMAFANLGSVDTFHSIPIAVVLNDDYPGDGSMQDILREMSDSSKGTALFILHEVSPDKAADMLDNDEITAYIEAGDDLQIYFRQSGLRQSIAKIIFDSILRTNSMVRNILMHDPEAVSNGLLQLLEEDTDLFRESQGDPGQGARPDSTVIYFYSLMAMTCFYGAFQGLKEVDAIQADLSAEAMRVNVSPLRKMKIFLSSISSAAVIETAVILILLAFLIFVLGIDFGRQTGLILLVCLSGCFAGISFGIMIGALIKGGEGMKTAVLIGTTMVLSFLSGMMQSVVKYAVTKAVPAMAYLNPLNLITDAFYALYYYPDHRRFFINIACLWGFTLLFSVLTVIRLRRVKYASV